MTIVDAVVILLGVALVLGELWYIPWPRQRVEKATATDDAVQEVLVLVKDGYHPAVITVEAGRSVRLLFYRDETAECSQHIVFNELGIDRELPPFETTVIEFTPNEPGDYHFQCGYSKIRGRVVAEIGREGARSNLGKGHLKHG